MGRKRIVLITTGGTVAAHQTAGGAVPVLHSSDLVHLTREAFDSAGTTEPPDITTVDLMTRDSSALHTTDQFIIATSVAGALADPQVAGVVVTHGTDTMEETAYLVDLYAHDPRPVVFTGAQRPSDHPDADGPANIVAAIACAIDPASTGHGVQIVVGGDPQPVRGLFKVETEALAAYDVVHPALGRPLVDLPIPAGRSARVDTIALYPGVSPGTIAAAVAQNAAGIVLSATGSGNTHPDITAQVSLAVQQGVTVVVSTRVPYGEVAARYGGGGGAVDLVAAGALVSAWLRAPQARMALIALLTAGATRDDVASFLASSGPG
ncbi:MAG TPA: asparaginase domain-containing protein [Gordonia sp. (in: high G+C Gram-positive bacteria)]|uniref:asparaginase domain-containing protein n=1 Tax=unclassified Gordonia (in: high G+C Gram-positive bacteria) TaxID=2657482 RepID=UPI000FC19CFA|nr:MULTISPECIES: asparaginase domain-containing protein [unclassified Gordonia (in: high G+C Gram-positive bacteria)]RUP35292.1 MAG: asparaginase [Gordonia sp. (in: high G+C Gram-positive bacteria)]HNP58977.1 asparaginase domain-containing protein [Gordonia sp. (in: high G+C Gram-positive bacteria)]HRC52707.1 asparaginase domain-containing protein [Gordonia sp. (in: high G+C Gram-positive bacteria)]